MIPLPNTRHCFVCGLENQGGFALQVSRDHQAAVSRFRFRPDWCGFPGTVHGGLVATALDEIMVWAVGVASGRMTYCAELSVRYQRPTRPDVEVTARGELTANRRDRLFLASATLVDPEGTLLAEATGKYLPVPEELLPDMLADFLGDPTSIFRAASGMPDASGPANSSTTPPTP